MQSTSAPHSAIWRTAEFAVGGDLPEWLTMQRTGGSSFQFMAGQLAQRGVMISHETVRAWCSRLNISTTTRPSHGSATDMASGSTGSGS